MKVFDIQNEERGPTGFEVGNLFLSRREAGRVLERIQGVTISRPVRRLFSGEPDLDDFCVFQLGNVEFTLEEPWGDSSRYIISSRPGTDKLTAAGRQWRNECAQ